MSEYEKQILCIMIMADLTGDCGYLLIERAEKVASLAQELGWEDAFNLANDFLRNPEDGFRFNFILNDEYRHSLLRSSNRDFWSYSVEFQKEAMTFLTYLRFNGEACS